MTDQIAKYDVAIRSWLLGEIEAIGFLQYEDHHGFNSDGISTSGKNIWERVVSEVSAYDAPRRERAIIARFIEDSAKTICRNLPLADLGSGGSNAIRQKIAPIAKALNSPQIVLVDLSSELLRLAGEEMKLLYPNAAVKTLEVDFMRTSADFGAPHLVTLFGITSGNIDATIDNNAPPFGEVVSLVKTLLDFASGGFAFFTFDECLNERENAIRYSSFPLCHLHLNVLDWAVAEGRIAPEERRLIYYHPTTVTWRKGEEAIAGAIIHRAHFSAPRIHYNGEEIRMNDDRFRKIDHSLKFSMPFMMSCIEAAGGTVVRSWKEGTIVGILIQHTP